MLLVSCKSWDYIKTFSKHLYVVKNQTLFTAAREYGSKILTRGICCSPTSLKDQRKICLLFLEEKEVENTRTRSGKRALYIVYICLCDETMHSYKRKTNGVKRESFAITRFERADIQMRSRVQNTVEKRSVQQFSLLCFWLVFFVL